MIEPGIRFGHQAREIRREPPLPAAARPRQQIGMGQPVLRMRPAQQVKGGVGGKGHDRKCSLKLMSIRGREECHLRRLPNEGCLL